MNTGEHFIKSAGGSDSRAEAALEDLQIESRERWEKLEEKNRSGTIEFAEEQELVELRKRHANKKA
jgi:hypothetical protein